jgi:hypothetical protein
MVCTLFTSYVNTAIIPLLVNADLTYAPFPFNWIPLEEIYTDLTGGWW